MSSILNEEILGKIKPFRSILLKTTVWIFVGGVALGAILILMGANMADQAIWKVCGTLFILAVMMVVSVNNFKMLETRNGVVQGFAILALVGNLLWALMWMMAMWGIFDIYNASGSYYHGRYFSVLGKITLIVTSLSVIGLFVSNILNIKEYDNKAIKPLKITAVSCIIYEELYAILAVMADAHLVASDNSFVARLGLLASFTQTIWVIAAIVALIMSVTTKNRQVVQQAQQNQVAQPTQPAMPGQPVPGQVPPFAGAAPAQPGVQPASPVQPSVQPIQPAQPAVEAKTDEQLRAKIEQKVRAEMIEKEVRERLAREQVEAKNIER